MEDVAAPGLRQEGLVVVAWYTVGIQAALRDGPWAVLRARSTAGPSGRWADDAETYQWT